MHCGAIGVLGWDEGCFPISNGNPYKTTSYVYKPAILSGLFFYVIAGSPDNFSHQSKTPNDPDSKQPKMLISRLN